MIVVRSGALPAAPTSVQGDFLLVPVPTKTVGTLPKSQGGCPVSIK